MGEKESKINVLLMEGITIFFGHFGIPEHLIRSMPFLAKWFIRDVFLLEGLMERRNIPKNLSNQHFNS